MTANERGRFSVWLPPPLAPDAHKGSAGRVLAVAGSRTMPGAAILLARAAQRSGAGLVICGLLDPELLGLIPAAAPEAVLAELEDAEGELGRVLAARQPHALAFGPGVGDDDRARVWLGRLLTEAEPRPLVLDADALNALHGEVELLRTYEGPLVLTPHPGEAARLLGAPVPRDDAGRAEAARTLARRSGAIVCLKGRGTVLTDGDKLAVNDTGNPGMATAGSGDVLCGILLALLAAFRHEPDGRAAACWAAALAVHVHGLAGDLAAARLGQRALVASDLIDALPEAWRALERLG